MSDGREGRWGNKQNLPPLLRQGEGMGVRPFELFKEILPI